MPQAQGRITVRRRPKDGEPGVSYAVLLTPNSLSVASDGTIAGGVDKITAKALKIAGETISEATDGRMMLIYTRISGGKITKVATEINASVAAECTSVSFEYRIDGKAIASAALIINREGKTGKQGLQGCIYRETIWESGIEYHNDTNETDGIRYIDIVLIESTGPMQTHTGYYAYMCRQTHASSASNNPQYEFQQLADRGFTQVTESEHWIKLNPMAPIHTPFILADGAVIKLLQSNQIIVMKEDGSTVNVALGGGSIPLWVGAETPDNAPFYVDATGKPHMTGAEISGRVTAGDERGQRVVLDPGSKGMRIYNAADIEMCSFNGKEHTDITDLFQSLSGSFPMLAAANDTKSVSGTSLNIENSASSKIKISSAIQTATPVEITVDKGNISASQLVGPSGPSGPSGIIVAPRASAEITLRIVTYDDAGLTDEASSVVLATCKGNGTINLAGYRARTATAGYHVLEVEYNVRALGNGSHAAVYWGSEVSGGATFSVSYVSDSYCSTYFANGFCLGQSAADYIMAYRTAESGMRFVMENGGWGFDINKWGIKYRHHRGNWIQMPMFIFHGLLHYNSSTATYSWSQASSWDDARPTITRLSAGKVKISYPASWTNSLYFAPGNVIVNVQGYANGDATKPIKATLLSMYGDSVNILVSHADTLVDSGVMVDITWLNNTQY